jgi:hypothetical protein
MCLQLIDSENALVGAQYLHASDNGKEVEIVCLEGPLKGKAYSGVDYFWMFADLRADLKENQLRPLAMGAKRNVFAGGLAGETSLGYVIYMFDEQGEAFKKVKVFDPVDISEATRIVFFDEQKAHRKALTQRRKLKQSRF